MAEPTDLQRNLQTLAAELQRLETEYNLFFAGRLARPPQATRARVDGMMKRFDRAHFDSLALRFRFSTLQARYSTFAELWDRGLRAREEGRQGPFPRRPTATAPAPAVPEQILHVVSFSEPASEPEKVRSLYEVVMEARRARGEPLVPFPRFADLVREQVASLRQAGSTEVAFRVTVKDGKVNLTAKALKGEGA